ncbi:thioredoxin-like [Physella acuta]|uniref:thioredoxin-like n=1 Tax=Physella acuta TaxID=109671 RepID=UPI0027DD81A1|nr:thioredoxin-like [Physella acuta]
MELTGTFVSTLAELREFLAHTDKLVIVYFYTEWSPACRRIRFEFMQAELRNPDAMYLAANMDKAKAMAAKLDINLDNIPAIVVFKNGRQLYTATLITAQEFNKMDYSVPEEEVLSVSDVTEVSNLDLQKT